MSLSPTKDKGIRALTDEDANFRADVNGLMGDVRDAVFKSGTTLPSASGDKWPGRLFFHETEDTLYVCSDALVWLPVGGLHTIDVATFGSPATGYALDDVAGASYVYRNGRRIDVRLRVKRTSGNLAHGTAVFNVAAPFRPAGVGSWPMAANQSGGGASSASVVAAVMNADGAIFPLSPGAYTTIELNGSYYIP